MGLKYFHARLMKLWRPNAPMERWQPKYFPLEDDLRSVAVWVRIPGLPIEFYDKRILWRIGNVLGKTVKIASNTLREKGDLSGEFATERAKFAMVCTEVDLKRILISKFSVEEDTTEGKKHEDVRGVRREEGEKPDAARREENAVAEETYFGRWLIVQKSERRNFRNNINVKDGKDVRSDTGKGNNYMGNIPNGIHSGANNMANGSRFNALLTDSLISQYMEGNDLPDQPVLNMEQAEGPMEISTWKKSSFQLSREIRHPLLARLEKGESSGHKKLTNEVVGIPIGTQSLVEASIQRHKGRGTKRAQDYGVKDANLKMDENVVSQIRLGSLKKGVIRRNMVGTSRVMEVYNHIPPDTRDIIAIQDKDDSTTGAIDDNSLDGVGVNNTQFVGEDSM
ncbi:hypothetical protein SESBI_07851 [Sesbania bispinosa]|nr:hypothetical protein SESBI_07851 [Sesbania bispinosa]